jgi:hypothetical protein
MVIIASEAVSATTREMRCRLLNEFSEVSVVESFIALSEN